MNLFILISILNMFLYIVHETNFRYCTVFRLSRLRLFAVVVGTLL